MVLKIVSRLDMVGHGGHEGQDGHDGGLAPCNSSFLYISVHIMV